jgi:radical SAM protein with 4Fe4S-binding SPASM domain
MQRPSGFMDVALYRRLLDEIGDYLFLILFWDWGEPFLHPSAFEMIADAHRRGIKIISSTNGHPFVDPRIADNAIQSGLDTLIFAIDGISQDTYERYRRRGDLEKALEGIRTVVDRKRALRSATPLVNFRFIAMKHNEHEIDRLQPFVRGLGADVLTLKTLNPSANNTYGDNEAGPRNEAGSLLPQSPSYRRFAYDESGTPVRLARNPCRNPWNSATVHWNGNVCPCTYDYDDRFVMGNLKNRSFRDIWIGEEYRGFRNRLRRNDSSHYFCRECSYAFKGGNCINETVREAVFFGQNRESE